MIIYLIGVFITFLLNLPVVLRRNRITLADAILLFLCSLGSWLSVVVELVRWLYLHSDKIVLWKRKIPKSNS